MPQSRIHNFQAEDIICPEASLTRRVRDLMRVDS